MENKESHDNERGNETEEAGGEITALRYTFVEMLFALAIAEVAIVASGVVRAQATIVQKLPVTAHLFLATVLIAASWLGWSASQWRRDSPKIETLMSWNFLGLLLDVLLVILYFILVRHAEISPEAPFTLSAAVAMPEAHWIIWIFSVYVVWDIVSDVCKEKQARFDFATIALIFASTACSIICVSMACIAARVAQDIESLGGVLFVDLALLSIVLLFRVIKVVLENGMHQRFPRLHKYAAFGKLRQGSGKEVIWMVIFVALYVLALMGAYLTDCMSTSG